MGFDLSIIQWLGIAILLVLAMVIALELRPRPLHPSREGFEWAITALLALAATLSAASVIIAAVAGRTV
jgi:hypothetical protein